MAIPTTETEGTKVYIADEGTAVGTVTEIEAAITGGAQIGCIQDLGDIGFTRSGRNISCISTGEVSEKLGTKIYDPFTMSLLFNALDVTGQKALRDASELGIVSVFIIELSDAPEGTEVNPTYITFDGEVKEEKISLVTDADVLINMTLAMTTERVITDAAVITP